MLIVEHYQSLLACWPSSGRHILAQFDHETIIAYQAYSPSIGHFAVKHGRFGGEFSFNRMSWIKPNFLWMMYRCGWGTKENQEVVLALRISRAFFDSIVAEAVPSSFEPRRFASHAEWNNAVDSSSVRLQWDPDHDPMGRKLDRRAIQLGLRGELLKQFASRELLEVIDLSEIVAEQRERLHSAKAHLETPRERVYIPANLELATRLCLDQHLT